MRYTITAICLCTLVFSAAAQERTIGLKGTDFWEITFDGGAQGGTSEYSFDVTGRPDAEAPEETGLFSFHIRDAGPNTEMLMETGGLGTSLTGVTVLAQGGRQTAIALDPTERLAVTVQAAQARWCNPFKGCRFEFWRRRNGVEQSFTFANPVPVMIEGKRVEALKLLFHSEGIAATPAFSAVRLSASGEGTARVREQSRVMPDMLSDGLLHRIGHGTSAHVEDGALEVRPLKAAGALEFTMTAPTQISAWETRSSLSLAEEGPSKGLLRIEAQSRLPDSSLVPISVLEGTLSRNTSATTLTLAATFLTETYRLVGLNGREVATDLRDLDASAAVAISNFNCDIVPEFFENCPRFTFRTLPQHGDACAWTVQLSAPLLVRIDRAGGAEENRLDSLLFIEQREDDAGSWAEAPLNFTTVRFRASGVDRLSLFDQVVRPAHP